MSDGLLTPDEEQQLCETLDFDSEKIEGFLEEFFPEQLKRRKEKIAKAGTPDAENLNYTVTAEGEDWVEFEVEGRTIRLEREKYRGSGRRRANPYIDTRTVAQMGRVARSACYAVAAYKLRKEGEKATSHVEREAASRVRREIFKGTEGLAVLMHMSRVATAAVDAFKDVPGLPDDVKLEDIVLQALLSATAKAVAPHLKDGS